MIPDGLAEQFDLALSEQNVEYESKRKSGRLAAPLIRLLPQGHYAAYRARRVSAGAPEAQLKDPVLACTEEEWRMVVEGGGAP